MPRAKKFKSCCISCSLHGNYRRLQTCLAESCGLRRNIRATERPPVRVVIYDRGRGTALPVQIEGRDNREISVLKS